MALKVHPKHYLPTEDFEDLDLVSNLEKAIEKRHNDVGKPLAALSQEDIMRGCLTACDKKISPNLWSAGGCADARPEVDLSYADEVVIKDKFDPWTPTIMTQHGRESCIDAISEELGPAAGFPAREKEVWNLDGARFHREGGTRDAREAPEEERRRSACAGERRRQACGAQPGLTAAPQGQHGGSQLKRRAVRAAPEFEGLGSLGSVACNMLPLILLISCSAEAPLVHRGRALSIDRC